MKRDYQIGVSGGKAFYDLKKTLLFEYVKRAGDNFCFQCGVEIESKDELSIEHKVPYLDSSNPKELFFDLDNIAFSHLKCK